MKPWIIASFAALVACGPLNTDSPARKGYELARGLITGGDAEEQPVITEALLNAGEDGILFLTLRQQGVVLPMTLVGRSGAVETWKGPTGITVSFEDDIFVASRGLGYDLMGADPTGVAAAIAAGGGTATREHSFLNSLDQTEFYSLNCDITQIGVEEVELPTGPQDLTKFEEECAGGRLVFKNEYWTDSDGEILRSIQVLSPSIGFVLVERS